MFDYCSRDKKRVDELYQYCLRHCNEVSLSMAQGKPGATWELIDLWANHVVIHVRTLNESGLLGIIKLPQA
jgi:hypothetical protein